MEIIVCLKLEVDGDQVKAVNGTNDTEDQIKSKIRAWVADRVGYDSVAIAGISLYSSCLLAEIEGTDTLRIVPSHPVVKLPPDTKIQ
jgi:hypothetical protein